MSGIFFAALLIYFFTSYTSMEHSNEVYSSMDEPSLPIMYVKEDNYLINPMHAYIQEMGNNTARDMLTVLPENRSLELIVKEYDNMVMSVKYEIRSLDLNHLIENGTITDIDRSSEDTKINIPIQNLIKKEQEYLLKISLDTGEKQLNYYTRILWTDHDYTKQMQELALSFTSCTFDKTEAKAISQYLETTDIADNSTLAHVNLHNSFNQLTWGSTNMKVSGEYYLTLKEFSGVMAEVQISYESKIDDGNEKYFLNEDNYILRYDPSRIYIMDFDRKTHEIFEGNEDSYQNKKLIIGIANEEDLETRKSENQQFIAFKSNQELWLYDQSKDAKIINIFSYRSKTDNGLRANYNNHDVKIISVDDLGNVNFLVYGYMNRGRHEGKCGIVYYTYDNAKETVIENYFIALSQSYERIKENIEKLTYLSKDGMMYIYYDGSVYGIDTSSVEVINIVSGLDDDEFISSSSNQYIAYQDPESEDIYHSKKITLLDLETNKSIDITKSSSYKRVLGFNQDDLIYGIIDPERADNYTLENEVPISEIHIVGPDSEEKTNYSKDGMYFTNISVNGLRIQFDKLRLNERGEYQQEGNETIISNKKIQNEELNGLKNYNDSIMGKIWYIETKDVGNKTLKSYSPKKFSLEKASSIDLKIAEKEAKTEKFYAYSFGHYRGSTRSLHKAYEIIYDDYGYVTNENGIILWNRADKNTIVKLQKAIEKMADILPLVKDIGSVKEYANFIIVNATGIDMNSALYYLNKGYPLLTYIDSQLYLITSYDQFNITLINVSNQIETILGREDAEAILKANNYHFIGLIPK